MSINLYGYGAWHNEFLVCSENVITVDPHLSGHSNYLHFVMTVLLEYFVESVHSIKVFAWSSVHKCMGLNISVIWTHCAPNVFWLARVHCTKESSIDLLYGRVKYAWSTFRIKCKSCSLLFKHNYIVYIGDQICKNPTSYHIFWISFYNILFIWITKLIVTRSFSYRSQELT